MWIGTFKLFGIQLLNIASIKKAWWHELHHGVAGHKQAL